MNLAEELSVVAHMFKHFHRYHPVIGLIGLKGIDIGSDDFEVVQPTLLCGLHNILPLGVGVRHGADAGLGEVLCHP